MDGTWMEEWPNNWIEEELNRNPLPVCCTLGRLALEDTNAQFEETELSAEELLRNIYLEDDPLQAEWPLEKETWNTGDCLQCVPHSDLRMSYATTN